MDAATARIAGETTRPYVVTSPAQAPRSLRTLPEQIADQVYDSIVGGEYQPGDRIREEALAESFGVSRGPVREALRILERDSVVRVLPNRGAHVTKLSPKELNDIFEIRQVLAGAMVRRLATSERALVGRFATKVDELERLASKADQVTEYVAASVDLLLSLAQASGNGRLAEVMRSLARQSWRYTQLALSEPGRRRESARSWRAMFDALLAGRAEAAGRAMEKMVDDSRTEVLRHLVG
ncbi:GntR family transcriptional regulator [Variovorax paradoxus]|nr:GntR family transcriptional regulator [Variovorax paradoxus]